MDTDTIVSNAVRCGQAYQRGYYRGCDDEYGGFYNHEPLSGEWAGESIPELLGDLIGDDDPDMVAELCDHYEQGYAAAFAARVFCEDCEDYPNLAIHAVLGPDMAAQFRNLCCRCADCPGCY